MGSVLDVFAQSNGCETAPTGAPGFQPRTGKEEIW